MAIRAVVWDLGGVLVRTEDYRRREILAERLGMSREQLEELVFNGESGSRAQLGEIDIHQHWENVRQALGFSAEEMEAFRGEFWHGDRVDVELIEYIRSLRTAYRTGLLSNAFSNLRQVVREVWKFDDVFDVMVISAEEGVVKPDRRIYRLVLERLGVQPEEAVFIDDLPQNVEGARRVEMHGIHFHSPEQVRSEIETLLGNNHR